MQWAQHSIQVKAYPLSSAECEVLVRIQPMFPARIGPPFFHDSLGQKMKDVLHREYTVNSFRRPFPLFLRLRVVPAGTNTASC